MAAVFAARFKSPCAVCERSIHEGTDATWLEDEVVHLACASDPESHRPMPVAACPKCFMVPAANDVCGCDE